MPFLLDESHSERARQRCDCDFCWYLEEQFAPLAHQNPDPKELNFDGWGLVLSEQKEQVEAVLEEARSPTSEGGRATTPCDDTQCTGTD